MEIYKNLGGNSGVIAYKIEDTSISVRFQDGWHYVYTNQSTGVTNIEHMKLLANQGQGLNSFISKFVKKRYASKYY